MNKRHTSKLCLAIALGSAGAGACLAQTVAVQQRQPGNDNGMQVLTRGPVHEAFAETITFDPEPGIVVTKAPPEAIEELPPNQRPEGPNVDWIPGYWGWDDERGDFLWISGVWRDLPPGREWVPGYWGRSAYGFQWTCGYWADAQAAEIEYLPEPPQSVEIGPSVAAPSAQHRWIPGSWVWIQSRYAWQPGYWLIVQPNWDWIPAHYVWAPHGYVFVNGYWDHPVSRRGVLYAPVYFEAATYARRDFAYSPTTVINLSVFSDHLFVRPQYSHYYFGDYYAPSYRDSGFYASFSFGSDRRGYDPIYVRERWQHRKASVWSPPWLQRQDSAWDLHVQANFKQRRDHEDARPPRTLAAQLSYDNTDARRKDRSFAVASSAEQAARSNNDGVRFRPVDQDARQQDVQRGKDLRRFREERQRVESGAAVEKTSNRSEPVRMTARRSPIASKRTDQLGKDNSPPKRPDNPRPDSKIERKPRKQGEKRERPDKP